MPGTVSFPEPYNDRQLKSFLEYVYSTPWQFGCEHKIKDTIRFVF